MSGRGNPPQPAPGRTLVSLLLSEPFTDNTGRLTTWAGQFLQRLASLVGPAPSAAAGGQTITQLLSDIIDAESLYLGTQGGDGALRGQVQKLVEEAAPLLPLPPLSASTAPAPPLPPQPTMPALLAPVQPPQAVPLPYLVVIEAPGTGVGAIYGAGQVVTNRRVGARVNFPRGLSSSFVDCTVAPTVDATGPIIQNSTTLGTYTIPAAATAGTFSFTATAAFAPSDLLKVQAPAVADATMTGLRFTLVGTQYP